MKKNPGVELEIEYPSRYDGMKHCSKKRWKQDIEKKLKVVHTSDPDSFYQRCGTYSYKTLPHGKKADNFLPPSHEYELHRITDGDWRQIPLKKDYERVLFEAHGPMHVGGHACEIVVA